MAIPRIGGPGLPLNLNGAFGSQLPLTGSQTASSNLFQPVNATNAVNLPAGQVQIIPAGTFYVSPGPVTALQWLDPVSQFWRTVGATPYAGGFDVDSDGGNYRLANLSGCPLGAIITNAGSGYTNGIGATATGLTITPSAGGSVWVPVVGGAINTTVTITAGGTNYSFPPLLVISAPPPGGIQATATCTVSAGAINAVTVTCQGAGYVTAPTILVIPDFRDTTGSGAVLTVNATLVGSGSLLAMYPSGAANTAFAAGVGGHGVPVTTAPTFTFAPASTTAATAIMNFVVTAFTVTSGGAAYTPATQAANAALLVALGATTGANIAARAANTATLNDTLLTWARPAWASAGTSAGAVVDTNKVIVDPGFGMQAAPAVCVIGSSSTTTAAATATVGGVADTSFVQPF